MASEPLFLQLYLDENIFPDLAVTIRQRGFDCQSAAEVGMLGNSDEEQLQYAASQGLCLVSFNVRDFIVLGVEWHQTNRPHSGIVVTEPVSRKRFGDLLRRLLQLINSTTADEMQNQIRHL